MWEYQCQVERVVDGDTLDLRVDCGFYVDRRVRVRLQGLDTAEIYGVKHDSEEYERGMVHKRFVEDWVDQAGVWPFIVVTEKRGKYGRYIATLERKADHQVLNEELVYEFPEVAE